MEQTERRVALPAGLAASPWLLAIALICAGMVAGLQQSGAPEAAGNSSGSSSALWRRRPGCHRVGHSRLISIPGCVKFNLSTNACRGYCVSYSVPALQDIGAEREPEVLPQERQEGAGALGQAGAPAEPVYGIDELIAAAESARDAEASAGDPDRAKKSSSSGSHLGGSRAGFNSGAGLHTALRRHEADPWHEAARGGDTGAHPTLAAATGLAYIKGEQREVVSVGQCCSMMETEDVVVHVRCGLNEVRRLEFKSAKTCECFFCKHV